MFIRDFVFLSCWFHIWLRFLWTACAACRMKRKQQDPQCQPLRTKRRVAGRQPSGATATLRAIPARLLPRLLDCLEEELSQDSLARVLERFESKRRARRLCLPDDLVCCVFSFFARTPREWRALRLVLSCVLLGCGAVAVGCGVS